MIKQFMLELISELLLSLIREEYSVGAAGI